MSEQELKKATVDLDKMQQSPLIYGDTDYSEAEETEEDFDESKIFWMGTNADMSDTPQEQLENKLAIQEQVKKGILDEFGLPTGFTYDELGIPKDKQEEINAARAARKQQVQTIPGRMQSLPQHMNRPNQTVQDKKTYRSKFERKMDRERLREEARKQEKLARANRVIQQHALQKPLESPVVPQNTPFQIK